MTDKQFKFSVWVGGVVALLGALISTQASIGFGLLGLGVSTALLAVLTRETGSPVDERMVLIPVRVKQTQK